MSTLTLSTTSALPETAGRKALVTGGTGFVGANLVRRLLGDGADVHLLVRPGHRRWRLEEVEGRIRLHEVRLSDPAGLLRVLSAVRPAWVFHLAVHGGYPEQTDRRQILETNVVGLVNLVEACAAAGVEALVNTGSSSEYGLVDHPPAETERLEPNSDYAVTKAFGSQFCRFLAIRDRLPVVTLRLYSVYGPWEEPTRFVPTLAARGLAGELPPLVDPRTARDFVFVEDVCEAYVRAARAAERERGAIFNVGSGVQTTIADAVETARRVLDLAAEPAWGSYPARSWDTATWVADVRAIRRALGWTATHSFEEGFRKTVAWLRGRSGTDGSDAGLVRGPRDG